MNSKKIWAGIFAGAALTVLSACLLPTGDGEGLDVNGNVPSPDTNLAMIQSRIFDQYNCKICHGSSGNLTLSSLSASRTSLFGTNGEPVETFKAPQVFPRYRVQPGSADSSYLYQKLSGVFSSPQKSTPDNRMPQGGPYLLADELELVRLWIEMGAPIE